MDAVIVARREIEDEVLPSLESACLLAISQQGGEGIGKVLHLHHLTLGDAAHLIHTAIHRTDQIGIRNGSHALLQGPGKELPQATELLQRTVQDRLIDVVVPGEPGDHQAGETAPGQESHQSGEGSLGQQRDHPPCHHGGAPSLAICIVTILLYVSDGQTVRTARTAGVLQPPPPHHQASMAYIGVDVHLCHMLYLSTKTGFSCPNVAMMASTALTRVQRRFPVWTLKSLIPQSRKPFALKCAPGWRRISLKAWNNRSILGT